MALESIWDLPDFLELFLEPHQTGYRGIGTITLLRLTFGQLKRGSISIVLA
jgi:hypothetical protein